MQRRGVSQMHAIGPFMALGGPPHIGHMAFAPAGPPHGLFGHPMMHPHMTRPPIHHPLWDESDSEDDEEEEDHH